MSDKKSIIEEMCTMAIEGAFEGGRLSALSSTYQIKDELYQACEHLGAKSDLLCIIGSWGDTMTDEEILEDLRVWNRANRRTP